MSTLQVNVPDSIRHRVEHFAQADGVSVDDFVASILAQRIAAADADSYIQKRAVRGSAGKLIDLLAKAPDMPPEQADQITETGEQGAGGNRE